MKRHIIVLLILVETAVLSAVAQGRRGSGFTVVEATIPEMQAAMKKGKVTSRELVLQYLTRIAIYEDKLKAVITVNPNALKEAEERDRERKRGKLRGPLHGIPIALKDNIQTTQMPTTGGALAFDGFVPPYEATLTKNLRDAGAIIIANTADQDTAGPMAKTVADVAIMFGALESPLPDPNDPATKTCMPPPGRNYTRFLKADGLKGARIGIPRAFYYDRATPPGEQEPRGGLNPEQAKVMDEAIDILKHQGAIVIDPADIPSVVDKDPKNNLLVWNTCSGVNNGKGKDADCSIVFKYGMKRDFNRWLETLGASAPVKTLTELRNWNVEHAKAGAVKYGQSNLDISDEMDLEADRARYEADRAKDVALAGTHGIDEATTSNRLDAILFPGASGAAIAAKPGYPTVIVPFGLVPNAPTPPFPEGFNAKPAPFGVSFTGMACSEPRLIELAYAFEKATKRRVPPPSAP